MKGLHFHGARDIRYEDMPDAEVRNSRGLVVRMKVCGICGSDLHLYEGHTNIKERGFCIGHEAVGEVVAVGSGVRRFKEGDDVILAASVGCGECTACIRGDIVRCTSGKAWVYGLSHALPGCQAEQIWVPEADINLKALPEGLTPEQGVLLTDNLPTAWFGAINADVKPGDDVAVVGLGPVGLMAVECAFALGAGRVFALDLIPERRAMAESLGAIAFDPADEGEQKIIDATGGRGVRSAIEAVGVDATAKAAIKIVGVEGVVSAIGVNLNQQFEFPMLTGFAKNLTFRIGGCPVQRYWDVLVDLIQKGRLKPERFITNTMSLSQGAEAYRSFDARQDGVIKTLLTP